MANPVVFSRLAGAFHGGGVAGATRTFLGTGLARPPVAGGGWLAVDTLARAPAPSTDPVPPAFPLRP